MAARGGFSSKIGFIAAAAGSAVGLGNIWKFPYEAGENGGAAFLFVYLACMLVIGFPIMVGEIAIGRAAQKDPYGSYRQLGNRKWGIVGLFGIISGVMILSFYNVVAGWAFGYFYQIIFGNLLEVENFGSYFGAYVSDVSDNMIYSFVFMIFTAIVVIQGVQKGIEKASQILMPILLILLATLIIYSLTLPGALQGAKFYLVPNFSDISLRTIYTAMGQSFFSLSLGMGALITYGSYISKKENIISSAITVTLVDGLVAFMAGLLIFPLVFSQGQAPSAGPGLVFVALPGIFQEMGPIMGRLIGGGFFLLLCFAALTSTISLLEVPVAFIVDEKNWPRKKVVFGLAFLIFLIGIPSMLSVGAVNGLTNFMHYEGSNKSFLDLIEDIFSNIGLPLGGFMLSLFVAFKWKTKSLSEEIAQGNPGYEGSLIQKLVNFSITVICPIILGTIFLITMLTKFLGLDLAFV
ncbi:sodium-dependent transporter [Hyphobacterium sp. CCMP332]|nr:sodium-dependent transporter [Hyphobacterium sp. CCMP332]